MKLTCLQKRGLADHVDDEIGSQRRNHGALMVRVATWNGTESKRGETR